MDEWYWAAMASNASPASTMLEQTDESNSNEMK